MPSTAGATGAASDASVDTKPRDEEETPEEHAAKIRAVRIEQADAAVASAEAKIERAKEDMAGAEASLKKAEARRASLEE